MGMYKINFPIRRAWKLYHSYISTVGSCERTPIHCIGIIIERQITCLLEIVALSHKWKKWYVKWYCGHIVQYAKKVCFVDFCYWNNFFYNSKIENSSLKNSSKFKFSSLLQYLTFKIILDLYFSFFQPSLISNFIMDRIKERKTFLQVDVSLFFKIFVTTLSWFILVNLYLLSGQV